MFSGDRERVHWERIGYNGSYFKKKICRQFCIKWPQMKNTSYLFTTQILFMWKFLFLRYIYKKGNVKVFQSFNLRCFLSYWCAPLSLPIKLQSSSKGNIKRSIVYIILIFCTHLVYEEALKCHNGLNYLALSINEIAEFFKPFALSNTPQQATKRCKDVFFILGMSHRLSQRYIYPYPYT